VSLRDYLRAETLQAHRRLDAGLGLDTPHATLERYGRFLAGMRAFCAAVEPKLGEPGLAQLGIDLTGRARLHWLDEDLAWFGLAPTVVDEDALPAMDSAPQRLGVAYVLEGSTLGGAFLYRQLSERWDLAPRRGASYLYGHGPETGAMWKRFVQMLDAAPLDERERVACAAAAGATFERLSDCLAR